MKKKIIKDFFENVMEKTGRYAEEDLMESDIFVRELNEKDVSIKATAEFDIMNGEGCLCFEVNKKGQKEYIYMYDIKEKKQKLKELIKSVNSKRGIGTT